MINKAYSYIRFSTPDQIKGDSLRRQVEASEKYTKEHGLELDSSLKDLGISAFKGKHAEIGALGRFLNLVENGKIAKGSYLLVENLDRLSRESVMDALNQFTNIIKAGIKIVTMQDGMEYDQESIEKNWAQLIISISIMARAHEESKIKSERVGAAWQKNRDNASNGGRKLTSICPSWLKLSKDKMTFKPIPEVVEAIKEIFRLKIDNRFGRVRITKMMNEGNFWKPLKGKRNKIGGWQESYITKILNSKAVYGEFQPHTRKNGKRFPIGEVVENYYPAIINKGIYLQAQEVTKDNAIKSGNAGGKTEKGNNLFTHLVKCGLCGSPMQYMDKGKPPKGGKYLHCSSSRFKRGCDAKMIRYDEFEKLFFDHVTDIDFNNILPEKSKSEQKNRKNYIITTLLSNDAKISELERELNNDVKGFATATDTRIRKRIEAKMIEKENNIDGLKKETELLNKEKEALQKDSKILQDIKENSTKLFTMLQTSKKDETSVKVRFRVNAELKKYIDFIEIFPKQPIDEEIEWVKSQIAELPENKRNGALFVAWNSELNRLEDIKAYPESYIYLSDSMRLIRIEFKSMIKFPVQTIFLREPANLEYEI